MNKNKVNGLLDQVTVRINDYLSGLEGVWEETNNIEVRLRAETEKIPGFRCFCVAVGVDAREISFGQQNERDEREFWVGSRYFPRYADLGSQGDGIYAPDAMTRGDLLFLVGHLEEFLALFSDLWLEKAEKIKEIIS